MREIDDAHEALSRVEQHAKRSRFLLTHPRDTLDILNNVLSRTRPESPTTDAQIAQEIATAIDAQIAYLEGLAERQQRQLDGLYRFQERVLRPAASAMAARFNSSMEALATGERRA